MIFTILGVYVPRFSIRQKKISQRAQTAIAHRRVNWVFVSSQGVSYVNAKTAAYAGHDIRISNESSRGGSARRSRRRVANVIVITLREGFIKQSAKFLKFLKALLPEARG